jgi:hypothetical protein
VLDAVYNCIDETLKQRSHCFQKLSVFSGQVAGHKGKDQMLFDDKGECVFKPLHLNEYSFYKLLRKRIEKSPKFPKHFFPKFYGTMYLPSSDPNSPKHYIILENLTQGLKRPCICDLKVGGNSLGTDPHAGILKHFKQTLVKKVSTSVMETKF